jgi:guanylate kinase
MYDAINKGIKMATGDIVGILNADDVLAADDTLAKIAAQFEEKIASGEMLEYAEYSGNYYGTPKFAVEKALSEGKNVILEIETKGALQVREKMPEAVLIFILPPDIATLRARLEGRGTESAEVIDLRMAQVKREIALLPRYDYAIVNENGKAAEAAEEIMRIAHTERLRASRSPELAEKFE